jgi:predicted ATPase
MIGRQQEIELLQTLYRRMVADDRPDLVTVYGEAGIGKSRLVEEFQTWAEQLESPPTIVHGKCLPYGESMTYRPLAEILKRQAGVLDSRSTRRGTHQGPNSGLRPAVGQTRPRPGAGRLRRWP